MYLSSAPSFFLGFKDKLLLSSLRTFKFSALKQKQQLSLSPVDKCVCLCAHIHKHVCVNEWLAEERRQHS